MAKGKKGQEQQVAVKTLTLKQVRERLVKTLMLRVFSEDEAKTNVQMSVYKRLQLIGIEDCDVVKNRAFESKRDKSREALELLIKTIEEVSVNDVSDKKQTLIAEWERPVLLKRLQEVFQIEVPASVFEVQATPEPTEHQENNHKRGEATHKVPSPIIEGEGCMSKFELVKKAESPFAILGSSKPKMLFLSATRNVVVGENSFQEERIEGYIPSFVTFKERVANGIIQKGQFESVISLENEEGTMEYHGIDVHVIPHCEIEKKDGKVVNRVDSPILAAIKEGKKFFTLTDKLQECRRILRKDDKTGKLIVEVYVKHFKSEKQLVDKKDPVLNEVKKEGFVVYSLLTEEEILTASKAGEHFATLVRFFDLKKSNDAMKDIDVTMYNDIMEFVVKPDCKFALQSEVIASTIALSSFLKETVVSIQDEMKKQEEEKASETAKLIEAKAHLASKKVQLASQVQLLDEAKKTFCKENEPVILDLEAKIKKQEETIAKMKEVFAKVKNEGEAANTLLQKYELPLSEMKAKLVELTSSESFKKFENEIQELNNDIKALEFMMPKDESSKYDSYIAELSNQIKEIERFAKEKMIHLCVTQMMQLTFDDLDILHEDIQMNIVISEDEEYLDGFINSSARLFYNGVDSQYLEDFIYACNRISIDD